MRTIAEVQEDIWQAQIDLDDAKARIQELEDERIEIEDREAAECECLNCEGTGHIECPDDEDPEEWDYDCPDCDGSGEVA